MTARDDHTRLHAGMPDKVNQLLSNDATTLMFRRVPRKYSAWDMLGELEHHVTRAAVNFVYVPWENKSASNMGYAFVNFVDAQTMRLAFARMDGTLWRNAIKPRETWVVPAIMQGLANNIMRYLEATEGCTAPKHGPLVLHQGQQIPLQAAVEMFCTPQRAPPQQPSLQGLAGGKRAAPEKTCTSAGSVSTQSLGMGELSSDGSSCCGITLESGSGHSSPRTPTPPPGLSPSWSNTPPPPPGLSLPTNQIWDYEQCELPSQMLTPLTFDYEPEPGRRETYEPARRGTLSARRAGHHDVFESPGYAAAWLKVDNLLSELVAGGGPMSFRSRRAA